MPQFKMTAARKRALERIPDYRVAIEPAARRMTASFGDVLLADSRSALDVRETRHDAVYYFPKDDVRMGLLRSTTHRTFCPFKGYASYWSYRDGGDEGENLVWCYEDPDEEVGELKGYVAFYTDRVTVAAESGE